MRVAVTGTNAATAADSRAPGSPRIIATSGRAFPSYAFISWAPCSSVRPPRADALVDPADVAGALVRRPVPVGGVGRVAGLLPSSEPISSAVSTMRPAFDRACPRDRARLRQAAPGPPPGRRDGLPTRVPPRPDPTAAAPARPADRRLAGPAHRSRSRHHRQRRRGPGRADPRRVPRPGSDHQRPCGQAGKAFTSRAPWAASRNENPRRHARTRDRSGALRTVGIQT
jgi:hypothetical protein